MAYLSIRDGRVLSGNHKGQKLTPKMLSFIDAYFGEANFNASKAYELSDYVSAGRHASILAAELMNHPLVRAEVKRRTDLRSEKSEVKAEWLINKLMTIVEATEKENPQAALRGIELLGKSIAMWKERQEISGPDGEAIRHEQHVKESVADFTSRISSLVKRSGADDSNIVPIRGGTSGT